MSENDKGVCQNLAKGMSKFNKGYVRDQQRNIVNINIQRVVAFASLYAIPLTSYNRSDVFVGEWEGPGPNKSEAAAFFSFCSC